MLRLCDKVNMFPGFSTDTPSVWPTITSVPNLRTGRLTNRPTDRPHDSPPSKRQVSGHNFENALWNGRKFASQCIFSSFELIVIFLIWCKFDLVKRDNLGDYGHYIRNTLEEWPEFAMLIYIDHLQKWFFLSRSVDFPNLVAIDFVQRVKFGVSGHSLENTWKEWPKMWQNNVSWPTSELNKFCHTLWIFQNSKKSNCVFTTALLIVFVRENESLRVDISSPRSRLCTLFKGEISVQIPTNCEFFLVLIMCLLWDDGRGSVNFDRVNLKNVFKSTVCTPSSWRTNWVKGANYELIL